MSDGLSWSTAIDTSGYEAGTKRIEELTAEAASSVEAQSERINAMLNDVPEVNLDFVTNAPETADQLGEAYAEIYRVIRLNEEAVAELSAEYNRLTDECNKYANVPSKRDEVAEMRRQKTAIKENIEIRKDLIAKTKELTKVVERNEKAFTAQTKTQTSVKQRIREIVAEMANLRNQYQMEGKVLDESKGKYRELAEELGRLKDIQGDVQTQAKILSNDQNQFQGVISGLSGLSGGFTAAQGAMALFGTENENLQAVMTKLQAVMAITMGLQQVQQMLNKDSAFSLVTLNSLKAYWNRLLVAGTGAQVADNAANEAAVATTTAKAVATEAETVAEEVNAVANTEDAVATTANAEAKTAKAAAAGGAAVAEGVDTAATSANAAASVAGTAANIGLAGAFRMVGAAIKSIPVFGWILAGIAAVIKLVSLFNSKNEETNKKLKDQQELLKSSREAYAKANGEVNMYIDRINKFNGTQEEEKRLLKEVNDKFGEQIGYAENLQQAKDLLTEKGDAYCKALEKEALAQAYLNKYVEAYINLLEVQDNVKAGKYHHWYNTKRGDAAADREAEAAAQADVDRYLQAYENAMQEAQQIRQSASLGGHTDPNAGGGKGGGSKDSFDPKRAAQQRREALKKWRDACIEYTRQANQEVNQANLDAMEEGLDKEIAQIQANTRAKIDAWKQHLLDLGAQRKALEKAYYLAQKGHTEEGWENSDRGKMSNAQYANELLDDPQNEEMANQYYARISQITEQGEAAVNNIRKKYHDQWINDYGTDLQKAELLSQQWTDRLKRIMLEAPELYEAAEKAMQQDMAKLNLDKFKMSINWDDVFGDLGNQSLQSLQFSLDKVKTYFEQAKGSMSVTEIKDFQEAITKMEDEIASRNPFTALHKSFKDISDSKTELVNALADMANAQRELNAATEEYNNLTQQKGQLIERVHQSDQNDEIYALELAQEKVIATEQAYQNALQQRAQLQQQVAGGDTSPETAEMLAQAIQSVADSELARNEALTARNEAQSVITDQEAADAAIRLVEVNQQLEASTTRVATAQQKNSQAEQRVVTARNNVTKSYKQFSTALKSAGGVVTDIGGKAQKLAKVFSDDIADAMGKAIDFIGDVLDATSDVISAVGDVGKSVAKGMETTVDAMGQSTKATAAATATSISTVEKASVILTVISAALQIATAIANLFNNDDAKQKEIEKLQERIDQLQWELDNAETVRLQNNMGKAVEKLKEIYAATTTEVLRLHGVINQNSWQAFYAKAIYSGEIYAKTVERIADYWAKADYTANKALGNNKFKDSRAQLENLAEQQLLIQKQINEESSKKKSDSGKIQDYKNQIAELANEMANLINDMLEEIMGASAQDLSKTLGDAFFDAVSQGEDAMEAWAKSTKEIVRDIIKQMIVAKFIEEPIGEIFNRYKTRWFGTDGQFKGVDAVINSADDLAGEINAVGEAFSAAWDGLSGSLGKWFDEDAEREGTSRGIATASQESVDENNARLTTIQGHTYTLVQGLAELNGTANAMLDRLTGIESNTGEAADRLATLEDETKRMRNTLETIQTSGLRLK